MAFSTQPVVVRRRSVRQPGNRRQYHPGDGRIAADRLWSASGDDDSDGLGRHRHLHRTFADNTAETITLHFTSSPVLTATTSSSIVVSPAGVPVSLAISTQPSPTATAGVAFSTQPVVYVEDQYGNLETGDNTTQVTAALSSGTGPLHGNDHGDGLRRHRHVH